LTENGLGAGPAQGGRSGGQDAAPRRPVLLVVDDEPFILSALSGFFHHMLPDTEVRPARTAREALALLAASPADLVISDYRMPDMDGIEFLARVAEHHPQTLRVLFTAFIDAGLEEEARRRARIHAFVPKGADPRLLLDAVRDALDVRSRGLTPQAPASVPPASRVDAV
jgi:DNA-binding NarL/FixJ family response regulator